MVQSIGNLLNVHFAIYYYFNIIYIFQGLCRKLILEMTFSPKKIKPI